MQEIVETETEITKRIIKTEETEERKDLTAIATTMGKGSIRPPIAGKTRKTHRKGQNGG